MRNRIGKSRKHTVFFVILAFYLLFAPPIRGIHSMYFVALFSWIYLFMNNGIFFSVVHSKKLVNFLLVMVGLLIWVSALVFLNSGTQSVVFHYIYWIIAIIPGSLVLAVHTLKKKKGLEYILQIILWAALIQSFFSLAAFLNNNIKLTLISKLEADNTLVTTSYVNEINYRLFGFSAGLTFDMPSAMSIIACIAIYLGIQRSIKYMLFVPTIAFSAIINARTSAVVLVIGVLVILITTGKLTGKSIVRFLRIIMIAVVVLVAGSTILQQISPLTYGWVESGIQQILGFFQKDTGSGYFEYLVDPEHWIFPSGFNLIFGTGIRTMGSKFGVRSDVGYINDLWFGGVLYTIILYTLVIRVLTVVRGHYSRKLNSRFLRFIATTYIICFPLLNLKTFIVSMGAFSTIMIIIATYACLCRHDDLFPEALKDG